MARLIGGDWDYDHGTQYGQVFGLPEPREGEPEPAYGIARNGVALYSFRQAIRMGMLREVARDRGDTQEDVALELTPISLSTVQRWWRGEVIPTGLYQHYLIEYLTESL